MAAATVPKSQGLVRLVKTPPYPGSFKEGEHLVFYSDGAVDEPKEDEVLIKNLVMSLDPAMRPQMSIATYVAPVKPGSVMRASTVGEVVRGGGQFNPGDLVIGPGGWQEYYCSSPKSLQKVPSLPEGAPVTAALGILGGTGLTAYFGLLKVGEPKPGETVLVSGAAGATGNVVCQIAKQVLGCHVVGIAGGADKCKFLTEVMGLDGVIDYKAPGVDLNSQIRKHCPKGVDVFFDNVGGEIMNAGLRRMKLFGRIVACGAISGYNNPEGAKDIPAQYAASIVSSRIRIQGFIVSDFAKEFKKGMEDLTQWLKEGKLKNQETVVEGLPNAAAAFRGLFEGANTGKLMVRIADPSSKSKL